jgi:uncharacterized membrane protein YoaK (UPF0700 family)
LQFRRCELHIRSIFPPRLSALPMSTWRIGALAWVAGEIDTFGYLTLGQVFITHMTGNTGLLAIAVLQHRYDQVLDRALVSLVFFAGALCGAALVDSAHDVDQVSRALRIESALLAAFALLTIVAGSPSAHGRFFVLLLLSGSMGLQNAALTHPGMRGTHTTHLTGPMTDLATEMIRSVMPSRRREFRPGQAARFAARVIGFLAGGLCGAALFIVRPIAAPILAALTLLTVSLQGKTVASPAQ